MFSEKQNTKNEKKNIDFPILISKIQKKIEKYDVFAKIWKS